MMMSRVMFDHGDDRVRRIPSLLRGSVVENVTLEYILMLYYFIFIVLLLFLLLGMFSLRLEMSLM